MAKGSGRNHTLDEIEAALIKGNGINAAAGKILGITGQAVSMRVKKSKRLQRVRAEITEDLIDVAENKLLKAINSDNLTATIFYLKTKGKNRGYSERQEITGKDGNAVEAKVVIYMPDNGRNAPDGN